MKSNSILNFRKFYIKTKKGGPVKHFTGWVPDHDYRNMDCVGYSILFDYVTPLRDVPPSKTNA